MQDRDHQGLAPRQLPGIRKADKTWNDKRKIKAREDTTIHAIHQVYGKAIPKGTQYWTLCGLSEGEGTELDQITKTGVVKPEQFYGVEVSPIVYERNRRIKTRAHLLHGDFLQVMHGYNNEGKFNPAVVNYDSTSMTKGAARTLAGIFQLLSNKSFAPIILIANVVLTHRNHVESFEEFIEHLNSHNAFTMNNDPKVWSVDLNYYHYGGTGRKGCTSMGTLLWLKS
jgi:hypothetical protein